jgi:hypothetical protein
MGTLGKEAAVYSTLTKYVRNGQFAPKTEVVTLEPAEGRCSLVNEAILATLGECPFSSVQELSRLICLPRPTVHWHLTQSFRFTVRHLGWISHFLIAQQKRIRVDVTGEQCESWRVR